MNDKVDIWRQAYKGFHSVKPSAIIYNSNSDSFIGAITEFTIKERRLGRDHHIATRNKKVYWRNLELFDNEIDGNKKIFDIDEI